MRPHCRGPDKLHLLFDLDGTLTDPKTGFLNCIKYALAKMNQPAPSDDVLVNYIGPPLQNSFAQLLGRHQADRAEEAVALYRERYSADGLFENEIYPGIVPLLQHMRKQARTLHVATSKPSSFARRIIDHFGLTEFFDGVYGSELDGARSDKTELISHVLARENLAPDLTVMIGDRSHDMIGARNNGIRAAGILWGYGSREELVLAGADLLFETPCSLHSLV